MRFGILSTAAIARDALIPAIHASEHEAHAVASRDEGRATAFADENDIPHAYGSYEDLLADPEIGAVYNPLPNGLHAPWTKRAADEGLHVLCEKPLASDAAEAREVAAHCEEQGVTLMEAFMYRYHPQTERAKEIATEDLDDVRSISASFSFRLGDPDDVRLDPDLAGGSLMDVGCYAVSVVRHFLGEPDRVYARSADTRGSGVDTHLTGVLEYDDRVTAEISCSFDVPHQQRYRIEATNGWIEATEPYTPGADSPAEFEYEVGDRRVTERVGPVDQYRLEVEHFADCIASGEEPRTGAAEAIANMEVIDALYESAERGEPIALD